MAKISKKWQTFLKIFKNCHKFQKIGKILKILATFSKENGKMLKKSCIIKKMAKLEVH